MTAAFAAFWMQTAVIRALFAAVCIQNAGVEIVRLGCGRDV